MLSCRFRSHCLSILSFLRFFKGSVTLLLENLWTCFAIALFVRFPFLSLSLYVSWVFDVYKGDDRISRDFVLKTVFSHFLSLSPPLFHLHLQFLFVKELTMFRVDFGLFVVVPAADFQFRVSCMPFVRNITLNCNSFILTLLLLCVFMNARALQLPHVI